RLRGLIILTGLQGDVAINRPRAQYGLMKQWSGFWLAHVRGSWAAVCDAFRFLPARVHGKYTKHLVSIGISTHSDKMRIGDIPSRSTLFPPRLSGGCAEL